LLLLRAMTVARQAVQTIPAYSKRGQPLCVEENCFYLTAFTKPRRSKSYTPAV
jgi:hypothetical protein